MSPTPRGVGARVQRNEDRRHLGGQGTFLADIALPGTCDLAFVRSPIAHGRLRRICPPAGTTSGTFWSAVELEGLAHPIVADARHPAWRASEYPLLARGKVRFVGEPVAAVIAGSRALAEDLAEQVEIDIDELPPLVDPVLALAPDAPLVHDHWADNRFLATSADLGDVDAAKAEAAVSITRHYAMGRHSGVPMETRGALAHYDQRLDQLVVYCSTQVPHLVRTALAEVLGIAERRLRIVAPDVGGGFGIKCNLDPEVALVAAVALRSPYPVRWIEDRWEHFVGAIHARDHRYRITAHAAADGELLAVEADVLVDVGAYSVWPWTAAMEAGMSSGMIPGPYQLRNYRFTSTTVATNKPPLGPYRGVARPGACFAIERTMDELAIVLGMEPRDIRLRNLVQRHQMPYTSVTGRVYDSGDYPESVRRAAHLVDHDGIRSRQQAGAESERDGSGRRIGVGYAIYTEQTAHGTKEWALRGLPVVFGFEQVRAVLDPSGSLTLSTGIQSHGQGLETSLAQVAHDLLGLDPAEVSVRHGDTDTAPYGMGTFASRSMVMAGGAAHGACTQLADKVKDVAGALMGCAKNDVELRGGKAEGPNSSLTLAEIAHAAYLRPDLLPQRLPPGLDVTCAYQPLVDTGAYSYATHAAVVEVDLDDGHVRLLDYVVVEDCGTVVNPMIVDGQIQGGVAQGIGTALLEEFTYDELGQPKVTTFADYLMPGATEVPDIRIEHMGTPSPFTTLGIKGMGEGGAIAPPAAIANAVTDALRPQGIAVNRTPITPQRLWLACADRPARHDRVDGLADSAPWPDGAS
ncbi:xanthine dehydrogenase family protein molybdopterin-binding subunit [Pseudonocardia acidicola]|nr:xanthine dehydrogenase family protein molybdopterin-binding subunit [Pseudonocardia acidicola]